MSMNLHCEGLDLWQTPTHITYMCMSVNPKTGESDGGMEGVRRRYITWVRSRADGAYDSAEDAAAQYALVNEHMAYVMSVKNPQFFMA